LTKIEAPRLWRLIQGQGITKGVKLERGSNWHLARSRSNELLPRFEKAKLKPEDEAAWGNWMSLYEEAISTGDWREFDTFRKGLRKQD